MVAASCAGVAAGAGHGVRKVGLRTQVFLVDPNGGVRRLTSGPEEHDSPTWCAGGRRIVAISQPHVKVLSADDGRVLHRMNAGGGWIALASPSPDCERFATVVLPKGRDQTALLVLSTDGSRHDVGQHRVYGHPAWSPDGRTIYYVKARAQDRHTSDIWSIARDGAHPRKLVSDTEDAPRLSPSGRAILYATSGKGDQHDLWIARVDGTHRRRLRSGKELRDFGWMPDGEHVFAQEEYGHHRALLISRSGEAHRIGRPLDDYAHVALAPDGRTIAWTDDRERLGAQVKVGPYDGKTARMLADFRPRSEYIGFSSFEWSPLGDTILVAPYRDLSD
jgi:Tol biopolymer transport system component